MSGGPPRRRAARWGWVLLALMVGGAVVLLRFRQLDERRDEASDATVTAIASAVRAEGDADFERRIEEAEESARDALRESSALVDPWPAFLLTITKEIRAARGAAGPTAEGWAAKPLRAKFVWCLANGEVARAGALLEAARQGSGEVGGDSALPLYERLLDGVHAAGP